MLFQKLRNEERSRLRRCWEQNTAIPAVRTGQIDSPPPARILNAMNTAYDTVLTGALELPEDSRVTLVERLLISLTPDYGLRREHLETVSRRKAEIDSGAVQPLPVMPWRRTFAVPCGKCVRAEPGSQTYANGVVTP
jgi:hypothetical protein